MKTLEDPAAFSAAQATQSAAWLKSWKAPDATFQGKPFWCWNGKLTEEELLRQLPIFKEMGMGGVFMHSRTGLATEYLGEDWFNLVNTCADEAEKLGMEAWLYDEDRWPSGSAGGLATREDRYRMKYLRLKIWSEDTDWSSLLWPETEHFVAAFSARINGLNLEGYDPVNYGDCPKIFDSLLVFSWEHMAPHSFYNGGSYLDTLSREATEHFLDLTHDRYAEKCGDRIGKSIHGIFTDEPHHGFVMCDHHGQPGPSDTSWLTPWTSQLPADYQKSFGSDLIEKLPELYLRKNGERISRVKWEYMELIQQMFLDNWAKPMQDRCHRLGMTLTGHVLHEDSLGAQAVPCGSMMRYYEYLDRPGIDVLGLNNENFWVVKQLTSVGRQMGKPWLLSELYGCTGWQMGFDGHKRIGDWQALFGINIRCHHLSWYSMAGESKRDYPASIFFQSSWYREYAQVETYFSRLNVLLQSGTPCCDVLVINPSESVWAQIYPGWATWLNEIDPDVKKLQEIYAKLFTWLTEAQIDFDYGDEDHLARFGAVKESELRLGSMTYRTVIVCGMETIRASTLKLINQFQDAGGHVIFIGGAPRYLNARKSPAPSQLAEACLTVTPERESVVSAIREGGGVTSDFETDSEGLLCQIRREDDHFTVVMINPKSDTSFSKVHCRLKTLGTVVEMDCLEGKIHSVISDEVDGWSTWETAFRPLQERVFLVGSKLPACDPCPSPIPSEKQILPGPFSYELDEPNICVLDYAAWRVADGEWHDPSEILQIEEALSEQYQIPMRSGQMVQPWVTSSAPESPATRLELRFSFHVQVLPEAPVEIMMESPTHFSIQVNGRPISTPAQTEWFIDPCFRRVPLPSDVLKLGINEVILTCNFRSGDDLESIYLLGGFGVSLQDRHATLTKLPHQLAASDITLQGLPFYSGKLRYFLPAGDHGHVVLPGIGAACVTFRSSDGSYVRQVPWAPFHADLADAGDPEGMLVAELSLTRRNTFGPLHLVPREQDWIGPETFRTKGEAWSNDYQLFPAGLLAEPAIHI